MEKMDKGVLTGKPVTYQIPCPAGGVQMETFIPWTLVKRGVRREIITPLDAPQAFTVEAAAERTKRKAAQNTPLIRALGLAHYWQRLLDEGKFRSITDIARCRGHRCNAGPALAAIDAAGPGGCRSTARQSRCGDQSGERAASGNATGLAGAGIGVCAGVISRHSIYPIPWAAGVVGGAAGSDAGGEIPPAYSTGISQLIQLIQWVVSCVKRLYCSQIKNADRRVS